MICIVYSCMLVTSLLSDTNRAVGRKLTSNFYIQMLNATGFTSELEREHKKKCKRKRVRAHVLAFVAM